MLAHRPFFVRVGEANGACGLSASLFCVGGKGREWKALLRTRSANVPETVRVGSHRHRPSLVSACVSKLCITMAIKVKAVERNVSFDKNSEKWAYVLQADLYNKLSSAKELTYGPPPSL